MRRAVKGIFYFFPIAYAQGGNIDQQPFLVSSSSEITVAVVTRRRVDRILFGRLVVRSRIEDLERFPVPKLHRSCRQKMSISLETQPFSEFH